MARNLVVSIIGDSSSLEKELKKSSAAATTFAGRMEKTGRSMSSFGATMTKSVTLPIVGLGVVMVKAAVDGEKSTARLDQAFQNVGISVKGASKEVDAMEASGRNLGFTNEQIRQSLGSLVVSTGSLSKSQRELGLAEDLARFKGVSLEQATKALTMANAGSMRAIKQLGITIIPVTNAVDALKKAHQGVKGPIDAHALAAAKLIDKQATQANMLDIVQGKVRGEGKAYADTAAGGMAVFRAQLDNLAEKLGTTLLPILNRLIGYLGSVTTWFQQLSPTTQKVVLIVAGMAAAFGPLVGIIGTLTTAVGGLTVAFTALDVAMFANPYVLAAAAIIALTAAITAAVVAPTQFEAVLTKLGVSAGTAKTVVESLATAFTVLKTIASIAIEALWTVWRSIFVDPLVASITFVNDLIHGRWGQIWNDAKALFMAPFAAVLGELSRLKPAIGAALSGIAGLASAAFSGFINAIAGAAKGAFNAAKRVGEAVLDGIREVINLIKIPGIHISIPYPVIHVTTSSVSLGPLGSITVPTGMSVGIGHTGFDIPGFDPIPNFAVGGSIPGGAGQAVPIVAHAGEYVIKADSVGKLGETLLAHMNKTGKLPGFAGGGKINPTTGTRDDPAFRASAMYDNDYGYDRNQVEIGTALSGALGPRAQAQAAMRATYVNTPNGRVDLRHGLWRSGPPPGGLSTAYLQGLYPGITFELGTPGQQIGWMAAASRLPMGGQELGSLIASSLGPTGTGAGTRGSLVEMLTSHAVHFAGGGIVNRPTLGLLGENGPEAIVPLRGRQTTIVMQVDGRTLGKIALDYAHEQERWGGPVKVSR